MQSETNVEKESWIVALGTQLLLGKAMIKPTVKKDSENEDI